MHIYSLYCLTYLTLNYVHSQFVSISQQVTSGDICNGSLKTSPVEHFFNLIFSEFQHHPPVCVCVQMCVNQPTYCYPNGCFKRQPDTRKNQPSQAPTQAPAPVHPPPPARPDSFHPMSFLVDSQSDFMENLLSTKYVSEGKPTKSKYETQNPGNDLFRDPFKDRYQSIFKYRKAPKLHLRYNLREQVKHMKSDVIKIEKIDVSKTKWPTTAAGNRKQFFMESENPGKPVDHGNFYAGTTLGSSPSQYQSKFFKRDLSKKFPSDHVNDEVETSKDNAEFSLENLIENLIESSFGPLSNDTELDLNVNLDYVLGNNATTVKPVTLPANKRSIFSQNAIIVLNETTNVVSMNNSIENVESNKYTDDSNKYTDDSNTYIDDPNKNTDESNKEMYKNVFNDMIASLSKHIEKNNNSSVEMMEQVLGHRITEAVEKTETPLEEQTVGLTTIVPNIEETTDTTITDTVPPTETTSASVLNTDKGPERIENKKKSHQRNTRKLQNRKLT